MIPFELHELVAFVAIVKAECMTLAAEQLHVAQPALSRKIAHLESSLGATLFTRARGRLWLTPAGKVFFRQARHILELCDHVVAAAEANQLRQSENQHS